MAMNVLSRFVLQKIGFVLSVFFVFYMTGCGGSSSAPSPTQRNDASAESDSGERDVTDAGDGSENDIGENEGDGAEDHAADHDDTIIEPDDPGVATINIVIDSSRDRQPISPYIYGVNTAQWDDMPNNISCTRIGGNRWSAYNWETNASNAGSDYYHQNDGYLGGGDVPGGAVQGRIADAQARDASIIVTVPLLGYVAADKLSGGDVAHTDNYLEERFVPSVATKNAQFSLTPNTDDSIVYQDEFVHWVENTFPDAHTGGSRDIFYMLGNEPALWSSTHERIHPNPATYAEMANKSVAYALAIKAVAPNSIVMGPVTYGWAAMENLQSAPDANGRDFLDFYLDTMQVASEQEGKRLVDVLDLHWYPEARGGGARITGDGEGEAIVAARLQAPRSLWDADYVEDSWVARWGTMGPIRLLPLMQDKIDQHFPGTRISISEYYYGGGGHISGAIAQADVLGIFGRENVFAATLWRLGQTDHRFIWAGFNVFRDFDGQGAAFGNVSISAQADDVESSSIYASVDEESDDRMVLVVINKTNQETTASFTISHSELLTVATIYQLTAESSQLGRIEDIDLSQKNAFQMSLPSMSVSTIELTR